MRLPAISPTPAVVDTAMAVPATAVPRTAMAAGAARPAAEAAPAVDPNALRELVDKLNQTIGTTGQQVQFSIDHDTHQTVLRVTDAESGAVLRQIPGDEALSMARILDRMQGILIRQKA
ncbi:MAG: Flagellar protein [Pseudomonadota bacterium]